MIKDFVYLYNNQEYNVHIIYKRGMKSTRFYFRNGAFYITSRPYFVSKETFIKGLDKFAGRLIERFGENLDQDSIYLFGKLLNLKNKDRLVLSNGKELTFTNKEDLLKKMSTPFLQTMVEKVKYYENIMGIPHYRVKIKNMSSRFGSNSRQTHTLSFSSSLMFFSWEIIDSVIIHELCHYYVFDHSKKFYDEVYKYCPNYDLCRKKLIRRIYQ